MKRRLISVILFAVLAAAVSSTLLYNVISGNAKPAVKTATKQVLVASRDLEAGSLISDSDVQQVDWPATDASPWLVAKTDVVGRAILTPVTKNEPFAENRLAAKGATAGMASRIPSGMRAIAVHVDELTGLSRFILPGMHVDVISTGSVRGAGLTNEGLVSRTILQNVEVFSTGQNDRDGKEKTSVPVFNLLVTPQQAEVLSQAVAQTRIELVLRNPMDKDNFLSDALPRAFTPPAPAPLPQAHASVAPVRVEEKVEVKATPPPPPLPTVEVIHGTKRVVSPVAAGGTQ